jgi:hypothetical protein
MLTGRSLKVGQVYRYGRPYDSTNEIVDGMLNYFYFTHTPKQNFPLLEKGINSISTIKLDIGSRRPEGPRKGTLELRHQLTNKSKMGLIP